MKKISIYAVAGISLMGLLTAGAALAQTAPSSVVGVSSTPVTSGISSGSNIALGSFTLTPPAYGNAMLASLPLTLSINGSGSASNLSNCQLVYNGQVLTTGAHAMNALQNGVNTFMFDTPLMVSSGSTPTVLNLTCTVANGTPSGSVFQFSAGAPTFAPGLGINFIPVATASVGSQQILGYLTLDASRSGEAISLNSIPLSLNFIGLPNNSLQNCMLMNVSNPGTSLSTGGNMPVLNSGSNMIALNNALSVQSGTATTLALRCDVTSAAPVGSSVAFSLTPGNFTSTSSGGTTVTPISMGPNGMAGVTSGVVYIAPVSTGTGGTTTPGVPNTGSGGNANQNIIVLLLAGIVVVLGSYFLMRRRA